MSSTRLKNSAPDYACEQRALNHGSQHIMNPDRRFASRNVIPCVGINVGNMPNSVLAHNATDIESRLLGVGASNLVKPQAPLQPEQKNLPFATYFDRPKLSMPDPLVIEKNQRPMRP